MKHHDSEHDPVWDLLDKAPRQEAGDMFSRNVMRAIRLDEAPTKTWWQTLLSSRPVAFASTAVAAVAVAAAFLAPSEDPKGTDLAGTPAPTTTLASSDVSSEMDDLFSSEILLAAADNPELFSQDEIAELIGL